MNLAFEKHSIDVATKRLIEVAALEGINAIPDCIDLTNEKLVRDYLTSFAENEFANLKNITPGQIYGCAFKSIFVVFESMEHMFNISPTPTTKNKQPGTHLATFWECLQQGEVCRSNQLNSQI